MNLSLNSQNVENCDAVLLTELFCFDFHETFLALQSQLAGGHYEFQFSV